MCFSPEASFTAAAVLLPAGLVGIHRAARTDVRYVAICALPSLFGLQQLLEGLVWIAGTRAEQGVVHGLSLAYMFFSWLAWPVWVPFSAYFLEQSGRRSLYLVFAIFGGMLGALQYFPYFVHDDWLVTEFLPHAIAYRGMELLDLIVGRDVTYTIYGLVVIAPLLLSSDRDVKVFGGLVALVLVTTYVFFSFAYISVFCFGGALMSLYLVFMIFKKGKRTEPSCDPEIRAGPNSLAAFDRVLVHHQDEELRRGAGRVWLRSTRLIGPRYRR